MEVVLTRTQKAKLPKLVLGKATFEKIGEVASSSIVLNVATSTQTSGAPIKENAPSTIRRKQKNPRSKKVGGMVRPLVDVMRRFIKPGANGSWRWWAHDDYARIEPGDPGGDPTLKELSRSLQARGYRGWFGINKKARAIIKRIVKERLLEIIKAATKQSTGQAG